SPATSSRRCRCSGPTARPRSRRASPVGRPDPAGATRPSDRQQVTVEGRTLEVSNLAKVLYPATGFTKGEVIDYYVRVAEPLLAELRDRALTLVRWPNGVDGAHFYEKRCPPHAPDWVRTVDVPSGRHGVVRHVVCDDRPTL